MNGEDFQTRLLIELQRIAGAIECLCEHFGAMPRGKTSRKRGASK